MSPASHFSKQLYFMLYGGKEIAADLFVQLKSFKLHLCIFDSVHTNKILQITLAICDSVRTHKLTSGNFPSCVPIHRETMRGCTYIILHSRLKSYTNLAKGQQLIITCVLAAILFKNAEEKGYIYL
jgi:hypothetical protein